MMQREGYKVGEGLGKNSQGITTPLTIKKISDSSCIIGPSQISMGQIFSAEVSCENALKAFNIPITRVLIVVNLLTEDELGGIAEEQLKADLAQLCPY